jgi:hypothetical protein
MTINLETIWNDTYHETKVAGDSASSLRVFSAIHSTVGPILRLEVATYSGNIDLVGKVNLTPDQAEMMAAELLIAANIKRKHDADWEAHKHSQLPEAA